MSNFPLGPWSQKMNYCHECHEWYSGEGEEHRLCGLERRIVEQSPLWFEDYKHMKLLLEVYGMKLAWEKRK
ncbi:MAG: hypothetical protein EHM49_07470 [Deltaproteobacteria bacterium]|nr:MAG: hypothetical protein EHM49_07470 [Deltaproteobacteria bacterium]